MPDPLDTRDALRELAFYLAGSVGPPRNLQEMLLRRDRLLAIHAGLCVDAAAPTPPARTVTRAQYLKALQRLEYDHDCDTDCAATLRDILTALDLRVADDATEAPHA